MQGWKPWMGQQDSLPGSDYISSLCLCHSPVQLYLNSLRSAQLFSNDFLHSRRTWLKSKLPTRLPSWGLGLVILFNVQTTRQQLPLVPSSKTNLSQAVRAPEQCTAVCYVHTSSTRLLAGVTKEKSKGHKTNLLLMKWQCTIEGPVTRRLSSISQKDLCQVPHWYVTHPKEHCIS